MFIVYAKGRQFICLAAFIHTSDTNLREAKEIHWLKDEMFTAIKVKYLIRS